MIYLKRISKKFDKYIKNKNRRKYKKQKLKISVLKITTSSNILKNKFIIM